VTAGVQYYATLLRRRLARLGSLPPGRHSRALIRELRRKLGRIGDSGRPSDTAADRFWDAKRTEFRRQLLTRDPRRFAQLPAVAETMFVDYPPYIERELERLRSDAAWETRWQRALHEPAGLRLPRCPYLPSSSGNRIHHAHHLMAWEAATGARIGAQRTVLEIGGGYGGMAALAAALGFRGRYCIFDLPELSALQEFYLRSNDIDGVTCISELDSLASVSEGDLVIATWSLSEMPLPFRRDLLTRLKPRYWLLAYQEHFEGYDNAAFFSEWRAQNPGWRWQTVAADLIPGRHHYLFGAPEQ
jgi:hypothetical protein